MKGVLLCGILADSIGFVDTLKHYGVDSLDWVVLSHWHRDHVGGFLEFPSAIKIVNYL